MVKSQESSHSPKLGTAILGVGLGVSVVAYCLALRRFGLELADEGVLLAQFDRVAHGQVPYRDFHVGYGPALFWLYAASFAGFGPTLTTVRTGLAVVHGLRALALARLGDRLGGRTWAVGLVVCLLGFFLPVAPGVCAPGNIPYPAWFSDVLGLGALILIARERPAYLAIGALWGLVFAFKQNAGVFGVAAASVTVVLTADREAGGSRALATALALAMVAGATMALRDYLDPTLAIVFVLPLVPLAFALATARLSGATMGALARLGIGFVTVAGLVVGVMVWQAGATAVRIDFLQIGTDTIRTYHAAHPTLEGTLAMLVGATPSRAARLVADASWFAVLPLVHLAGGLLVATRRIRSRLGIAVVVAASLGYLQLYPRMDFWHLLPLAPTSLAALAVVATAGGAGLGRALVAGLLLVSLGRAVPTLPVLAAATVSNATAPRVPRLDLRWDLLDVDRLTRLPDVIAALQGRGRVAGFPALGVLNFALGEPSPWRHDYFFPGRPGAEEERALAAEVERNPPEVVVVLDAPEGPFADTFAAHRTLVDALERRFVEAERIGPYRLLVPRPPA
jgi:hypothetical protein